MTRYNACTVFCGVLNTLPNGATSFNNLIQPQQIIAVGIREEQQDSHRVLEHYLRAPPEFREIAITSSDHNATNSTIMVRELKLGHIAEYFRWRALMGHPERLGRLPAGAGAGGGTANHGGNPEVARPNDLEY